MSESPLKIVAAILDKQELTLYDHTGQTHIIYQGDPRLVGLVATIIPEIRAKSYALVTLEGDLPPNIYKEYEERSGGFVRFFKVARATLNSIFSRRQEAAAQGPSIVMAAGNIPVPQEPDVLIKTDNTLAAAPPISVLSISDSDQHVVDEIIRNAKPAQDPKFTENVKPTKDVEDNSGSTIVAITSENKVIPNIQNMEKHMRQSLDLNTPGMKKFIERISKVKRGHSVQDLLQFMQHGDLPVADDGSIIIYKLLYRAAGSKTQYVDAHTRKVTQRVGSMVFMNESLVDKNRNEDCSDGLHVAQRSYLRTFNGDVCILGRVQPEDVIAVPRHATNKMRVCGYEILAELSENAMRRLKANLDFTTNESDQRLLGKAIRGEFPPFDQFVEITQKMGGGVKVYPRDVKPAVPVVTTPDEPRSPVAVAALPDETPATPAMNAPVVAPKVVQAAIEEDKVNKPPTRAEVAQGLWNTFNEAKSAADKATAAQMLLDMKKKFKVSWFNLGFKESPEETLKAATKP